MRNLARTLTVPLALLLSCFWSAADAEPFSPAIDCGGREAIDLVIEIAANHDYGMMAHNAASKYFEKHPTQEFIDKKNYYDKAAAANKAALEQSLWAPEMRVSPTPEEQRKTLPPGPLACMQRKKRTGRRSN